MIRSCQSGCAKGRNDERKTTHVRQPRPRRGVGRVRTARTSISTNADLVFKGNEVVHVGPGYAGPADTTIDGKGFMAIPGFVNVHSHPFSEPANKGLTEEYGSDKLGQSSLYEYLPVFGLNPEDAGPSTKVALSELLKSGVTTITDLSMSARRLGRRPRRDRHPRRRLPDDAAGRTGSPRTATRSTMPGTRRPARRPSRRR